MKTSRNKKVGSSQEDNILSDYQNKKATPRGNTRIIIKGQPNLSIAFTKRAKNSSLTKGDLKIFVETTIASFDMHYECAMAAFNNQREKIIEAKGLDPDTFLTYNQFTSVHKQFKFPLQFDKDFDLLNVELQSNRNNLKTDFVKHFKIGVNTKLNLDENVKCIIKKFVSNNVLKSYTVQQERKNKKMFNSTAFCSCLCDSLCAIYRDRKKKEITDKDVWDALGKTFNLAKGWGQSRKRCKTSIKNPSEEIV